LGRSPGFTFLSKAVLAGPLNTPLSAGAEKRKGRSEGGRLGARTRAGQPGGRRLSGLRFRPAALGRPEGSPGSIAGRLDLFFFWWEREKEPVRGVSGVEGACSTKKNAIRGREFSPPWLALMLIVAPVEGVCVPAVGQARWLTLKKNLHEAG